MKKIQLFLCCILSSYLGAQDAYNQLNWGVSLSEELRTACYLNDNSYLLYTNTPSGIIQDKTTESFGGVDFWVSKFNAQNENVWQKSFGGSLDEYDGVIKELPNGDLIVGITTQSPISGNKTIESKGGKDYWVLRLDPTGNIVWQKVFGTTSNDALKDILVISNDQIVLCGGTDAVGISGDKTETGFGDSDIWMLMIDGAGNKIWDKTIGGTFSENMSVLAYNLSSYQIVVASQSLSGIGGLKTNENFGDLDIWVFSVNLNGAIINQQNLGGSGTENISGIKIDAIGNTFLAIPTDSENSGNKNSSSFGGVDLWVVKLDPDLNLVAQNVFGGNNLDGNTSFIINQMNDLVLVIGGNSSVSGNRTEPLKGVADCWFIGIDSQNLESKWQKAIGGSLIDEPIQIWETENSYKVVSFSNSPVSLDKTVSTWGDYNFWVFEFDKIAGIDELTDELNVFPNPCQDYIQIQSSSQQLSYSICDLNGQVVRSGNSDNKIFVDDLKVGIYFLSLTKKGITKTLKITKI